MKHDSRTALGQVMTPPDLVKIVLDACGYRGERVLNATVLEPSFGKGAFLLEIVRRIAEAGESAGFRNFEIGDVILRNVRGIERDAEFYEETIRLLSPVLSEYGLSESDSRKILVLGDALDESERFFGEMDFVVGNPPYVRLHNLDSDGRVKLKGLRFAGGTSDLYVAFYEIGLKCLRDGGRLSYVSPNSFLRNSSQKKFRKFVSDEGLLSRLYDFKSSGIFPDAGTYACVCVLDSDSEREDRTVKYREYDGLKVVVEENLPESRIFGDGSGKPWIFGKVDDLDFLDEVRERKVRFSDVASAKNGISTNRDSVYVVEPFVDEEQTVPYDGKSDAEVVFFEDSKGTRRKVEAKALRRCVKASRYDGTKGTAFMIFPYEVSEDGSAKPISEERLRSELPLAYEYLNDFRDELESRDVESGAPWFAFARSQGLSDVGRRKVVFRHLIDGKNPKVDPHVVEAGTLVYSGLYVVSKNGTTEEDVAGILSSDDFARYCVLVGKDMANGYSSVSSKIANGYGIP